jgi:hypothetical protein
MSKEPKEVHIFYDERLRRIIVKMPFPVVVLADKRVRRDIVRICGRGAVVAQRVTSFMGDLCICHKGGVDDWEIDVGIRGDA